MSPLLGEEPKNTLLTDGTPLGGGAVPEPTLRVGSAGTAACVSTAAVVPSIAVMVPPSRRMAFAADADPVRVRIVRLYRVLEADSLDLDAVGVEGGLPDPVADGQLDVGTAADGDQPAEPDLQVDRLAVLVRLAPARRADDVHAGHRGLGNQRAVHLAGRVVGHGRVRDVGVGGAVRVRP